MTRPPEVIAASGEVKAMQTPLVDLLAGIPRDARLVIDDGPYSTRYIPVGRLCAEARDALLAAPKTALQHFADEVEASGEAEPTRDDNELAADFDHRLRDWNRKRAPHFAIPPSTDVATLQRELSIAYDQIVRERGMVKELAAVLKYAAWRINDIRDMLMKQNGRGDFIYGCDEWSTPTVNLATAHKVITAALAKVQS